MLVQWAALQTAINIESHGMNSKEAFSPTAQKMPTFEWARVFLFQWRAIQYVVEREWPWEVEMMVEEPDVIDHDSD